jgi:hypothetical protein
LPGYAPRRQVGTECKGFYPNYPWNLQHCGQLILLEPNVMAFSNDQLYGKLTRFDLRAIYEYLSAIPSLPDNPDPGP